MRAKELVEEPLVIRFVTLCLSWYSFRGHALENSWRCIFFKLLYLPSRILQELPTIPYLFISFF